MRAKKEKEEKKKKIYKFSKFFSWIQRNAAMVPVNLYV